MEVIGFGGGDGGLGWGEGKRKRGISGLKGAE